MEILKTATGKEFYSDYIAVIPHPEQAYIRVLDTDITTVASIFSNPDETVQLWHGDHHLTDYTKLVAIIPEASAIKICLAR